MACFKADTVRMNEAATQIRQVAQRLNHLADCLQDTAGGRGISTASYWVVRNRINAAAAAVEGEKDRSTALATALSEAVSLYSSYENRLADEKEDSLTFGESHAGTPSGDDAESFIINLMQVLLPGVIITNQSIISTILNLISPMTGILYITSGIPFGNIPSLSDASRSPSASASADWLGYELAEEHPGVTAWVGKAGAEAQNELAYAGVNGYLGKVEAKAEADAAFMKTESKKEYKDGEWVEKQVTSFLTAEAGAGASVSVLAGDAEAGVGSDMLGLEGKAEGGVGNAKAEAKGKFSVGEDGVNAYAAGEAMVSAVQGEASGTINILGIEITGKVGGYAGAVGVEGKVGIENNKFVIEGGAAAIIGGSAGIEIGFNEEGWDNFVDFIIFWD